MLKRLRACTGNSRSANRSIRLFVAFIPAILVSLPLWAQNFVSFTGTFAADDQTWQTTFTLAAPGPVTLRSFSYAGGTNAAGQTIPGGGFDPTLAVFNAVGNLVALNRDGGCPNVAADSGVCWDAFLPLNLSAGTYTVLLTQSENLPNGPTLADSFVYAKALTDPRYAGSHNFTAPPGISATQYFWDAKRRQRTGLWAFDITGATSAATSFTITTAAPLPPAALNAAYSQLLSATGGNGPYTWVATGLPAGLTLSLSGQITGTPTSVANAAPVTVVATDTSTGRTAWKFFTMNVATGPPPVISLETPVSGASVWGTVDVKGIALINTPGFSVSHIGGVSVSIANNDGGPVAPVTDAATYPAQTNRNDVCGSGGLYPGGTDCPKVQFNYAWSTALGASGAFLPNGAYTVTATADDQSSPVQTTAAGSTVTVDNQTPSPFIVAPVNGSGDFNNWQTFTINFVSPHNSTDIGTGQIIFGQSPTLECTFSWQQGGAVSLLSGSQPCQLDTNPTNTKMWASGANQLSVQITLKFPATLTPLVRAFGLGQKGISVSIRIRGPLGRTVGPSFRAAVRPPSRSPPWKWSRRWMVWAAAQAAETPELIWL